MVSKVNQIWIEICTFQIKQCDPHELFNVGNSNLGHEIFNDDKTGERVVNKDTNEQKMMKTHSILFIVKKGKINY